MPGAGPPRHGIRMQRSIDHRYNFTRFKSLLHTLAQCLRCGAPCSSRLRCQTFCANTGPWEQAAQGQLGRKDPLHPLTGQGLAMAHQLQQTSCSLLLHPPGRAHLWIAGIMAQHQEHTTREGTQDRLLGLGSACREVASTLPRFATAFHVPA